MKTEITKESLIKFGMIKNVGGESKVFPMLKQLSEISDDDRMNGHTGLSLCVTQLRNQTELCLNMDGSILYINPASIEELEVFEKCIGSYSPNY